MRFVQKTKAENNVKLDAYDKKILFELAQNCRKPATQIGKKIGLSRDAVRYRINRLESSGVIQGYRTVIDMSKFGLNIVHLFLQLNQPTAEAEKQLVEKFKGYEFCRAVIKFNGKYDFDLAVVAKDTQDLDNILTQIIKDCGNFLQYYEILFISKPFVAKTFPDNFVNNEKKNVVSKELIKLKLDKTDLKLISIIADNANMQLYKIAEMLNLSADTAKYRMKKLIDAGVIKGFVPVINYEVIGYKVYAILLNISGLNPKREATLAEFLKSNKDVLWAVKTIGKYNVLLYICVSEPDALMKTTTALRSYFTEAVRDYETLINYEEYKYTYWAPFKA